MYKYHGDGFGFQERRRKVRIYLGNHIIEKSHNGKSVSISAMQCVIFKYLEGAYSERGVGFFSVVTE